MDTRQHEPDAALFGHGPAGHHGSWAPFIVATSAGFLVLGVFAFKYGWGRFGLALGLGLFAWGLAWWLREDVKRFRAIETGHVHTAGMPGPLLGMVLFICTEVLIFGSIFAIWFMGKFHAGSMGHPWRPDELHLPITATAINTAVLVASGGTLHWGYLGLKKNNHRRFLVGLVLTLLLGAAFLGQQVREYLLLVHEDGFTIKSQLYGSSFFMLTGTHGAHVFGGLLFLTIILWRSLKKTQTKDHHVALETAAIYWHFVDVVWIFLFAVVYLEWL